MKRLCAKEALKLVPDHGTIGLGGGETISYLCEYIKEAGKDVEAVTPSDQTKKVCKQLGITVIDTNDAKEVKIAFDGCDEVAQNLAESIQKRRSLPRWHRSMYCWWTRQRL